MPNELRSTGTYVLFNLWYVGVLNSYISVEASWAWACLLWDLCYIDLVWYFNTSVMYIFWHFTKCQIGSGPRGLFFFKNVTIKTHILYSCLLSYRIGRHSKSLDTKKKVCGFCNGEFELLVNKVDGKGSVSRTPHTPRTPNRFAMFVKDNYDSVKKSAQGLKHKDIMAQLSKDFAKTKLN